MPHLADAHELSPNVAPRVDHLHLGVAPQVPPHVVVLRGKVAERTLAAQHLIRVRVRIRVGVRVRVRVRVRVWARVRVRARSRVRVRDKDRDRVRAIGRTSDVGRA